MTLFSFNFIFGVYDDWVINEVIILEVISIVNNGLQSSTLPGF